MRKNLKKSLVIMMMTAMTATLCVSCGGGKSKKKSETTKTESSAPKAGDIAEGGKVTVGVTQDLDSLDPHNCVYAGTREVLFNIFEGLVKPTSEGELVPAVASEYNISEDGTVYSFKLRDGIKFHDGNAVSVDDVKYSIDRYAEIKKEDPAWANFKEITTEGDKDIKVTLNTGDTEFLSELTVAIIEKSNEANIIKTPVGTGPFKFKEFKPGEKLVVEKNKDYWNNPYPYLDEVTFKIEADTDAAMMQLQSGTIDIYQYLTTDQAKTLENDFNILHGSVNYVQALFLNNDYEPFKNEDVRKALCYAVDRDQINEFLFDGYSHIIGTNMIPAFKKYYNEDTEKTYSVDVEKAKELLKKAGYEKGFDLTITVPNNYEPHQSAAEIIVENLKEIGINAKINMVEFSTWVDEAYTNKKYQATVVAVDGTLTPSSWFKKNVSDGKNNFTNYKNDEYDELYKKATASTDDKEKVESYKKMQQILADTAASVYLEDPANIVAINKKLDGYVFYPVAAQDMSVVYFKK